MDAILTAPNIERSCWLFDIYINLSPEEQEKYDLAEKEFGDNSLEMIEQFMEDYFRAHGFIAA